MKKTLLFAAAGLMLSAAALAAPAGKTMGDEVNVPLQTRNEGAQESRPRVPALIPFSVMADTDLCVVYVSSIYDSVEVSAVLENLMTGELVSYTFDSSDVAVLPFSGDSGLWRITLTLENGTDYVGEFEI